MTLPFDGIKEMLQKMTPGYREKLIASYRDFSRLKCLCEARKFIEVLPNLQGIKVLKKTKEVKQLKAVTEILKPGRFKWIEKGIDIFAKQVKEKRKKTK